MPVCSWPPCTTASTAESATSPTSSTSLLKHLAPSEQFFFGFSLVGQHYHHRGARSGLKETMAHLGGSLLDVNAQ